MNHKPKILLIDNEFIVAMDIGRCIEDAEFEVNICTSVKQALETAEKYSFDIIVSDMNLQSEMTGLDVIAEIGKNSQLPPCIIITGYGDPETLRKINKSGNVSALVLKPLFPVKLIEKIKKLILLAENPGQRKP